MGSKVKLRDKQTGEIKTFNNIGLNNDVDRSDGTDDDVFFALEKDQFHSLAELTERFEDYEEPKEYWYIDCYGTVLRCLINGNEWDESRKQIGNYFETRVEAEQAVEKLKALKRLRDKGFKFTEFHLSPMTIHYDITDEGIYVSNQTTKDLDLLFGGEDEPRS